MSEATPAEATAQTSEGADANTSLLGDATPAEAPATEGASETPAETPGAPESYEFKQPEGREFDADFIAAFSEQAKELNLSQDAAQKLLDTMSDKVNAAQTAKIDAIRNEWTESSKADKEFGGDKLNENLGIAKQAIDKFGTPELKELLNTTGLGNHPEVIRFFYRAGKAISEDTFVAGRPAEPGKDKPKSYSDYAEALYK